MTDQAFEIEDLAWRPRDARPSPEGPPAAHDGPAEPRGVLWSVLCGGRLFYMLSAAMNVALLYFLYNPRFGSRRAVWFWDVLRDADGALVSQWSQDVALVLVLVGLSLAYVTASITARSRGRGLFAMTWVVIAFVAFVESRAELRYFLPIVMIGGGIGAVLYAAYDGAGHRRALLVTTLVLLVYVFLPMPALDDDSLMQRDPRGYRSIAFGVVRGHAEREEYTVADGEPPGFFAHHWFWIRAWLPQHALVIVTLFALLRLLGLRSRWLPMAAAATGLLAVLGLSWTAYELGLLDHPHFPGWEESWAGLRLLGNQWAGRFLASVLALAAAAGDLAARRR